MSEGNELAIHSRHILKTERAPTGLVGESVMLSSPKFVFIACGQVTEQERLLGRKIVRLVEELTPFTGYLAQYQSSFASLTENLLKALARCAGLVVMHPRGRVTGIEGHHTRASVWIEQEIAIATFLTQVLHKKLKVAAYVHKDIKREGMREELQLNPVRFENNDEVLVHLMDILRMWSKEGNEETRNPGSLGNIAYRHSM